MLPARWGGASWGFIIIIICLIPWSQIFTDLASFSSLTFVFSFNVLQLEIQVERQYVEVLAHRCRQERQQMRYDLYLARQQRNAARYKSIQNRVNKNCEEYKERTGDF